MDELRSRALRFIWLKEVKEIQNRRTPPKSYDNPNRKEDSSVQRSNKSKTYSPNLVIIGSMPSKMKGRKKNFQRPMTIIFLWMFQV